LSGMRDHNVLVQSIAFSPDGKRVASGCLDNTVKIWDVATDRLLLTLKGHSGRILSIAFSPDGKRLISGSSDHTAIIWDARRMKTDVQPSAN